MEEKEEEEERGHGNGQWLRVGNIILPILAERLFGYGTFNSSTIASFNQFLDGSSVGLRVGNNGHFLVLVSF